MGKYFFLFMVLQLFSAFVYSNTTRDLKSAPGYSIEKIKKLLVLHLNFERVNSGVPSFVINRNLGKAAQWHSDYMSMAEKVTHISDKKGMHDIEQRATSVGERFSRYAEITAFSYLANAEGLTFEKKKDPQGEYIDFGNASVRWLGETEIAMIMKKNILNNGKYASYLLNEKLNSIGGGITAGKMRDLQAVYASFAIIEKRDLFRFKIKMDLKKETVKKTENGKDTDEPVLTYSYSGIIEEKAAVLVVSSSGSFKIIDSAVLNGHVSFRIDDKFRSGMTEGDRLYFAVYDKDNDIYSPVSKIEVIK
jgi:hypothetical protein